MGYYSETAVKFELPKEYIKNPTNFLTSIEKAIGFKLTELFETIVKKEDAIYLYNDSIKWYSDFKDVKEFMNYISNWENLYDTGGVHFVRIGEEFEDIEELFYGTMKEYLEIIRTVRKENEM